MKKEAYFVFVAILLVNSIFVSAEWVGTETEFISSGLNESVKESVTVNPFENSWVIVLLIFFVLVVLVLGIYFRKVNKSKSSKKKTKVKKK
jgi:preprotein translocase subunit SecG